jgi:hypothetical protein
LSAAKDNIIQTQKKEYSSLHKEFLTARIIAVRTSVAEPEPRRSRSLNEPHVDFSC